LRKKSKTDGASGDPITPPGALGLIPEEKLDDPKTLRESLPKILDYQFEVLLPGITRRFGSPSLSRRINE
jgi:hypothetical protein